jgi:hypothetical protein
MIIAAWHQRGSYAIGLDWSVVGQFNYDFFNIHVTHDGAELTPQPKIQSTSENATRIGGGEFVPNLGFGQYQISIEGCDDHGLAGSICHQGLTDPIYMQFPEKNSCGALQDVNDNRWIFVDETDRCGAPQRKGFSVAVFTPRNLWSNPTQWINFGFLEVAEQRDIDFPTFQKVTLANNGNRVYAAFSTANTYVTHDGRTIKFVPVHDSSQWGILSVSNMSVPTSVDAWHLAQGDIINADGSGCVIIKNPWLQKALVLDMRDATTPRRVEVPLTPSVSCDSH